MSPKLTVLVCFKYILKLGQYDSFNYSYRPFSSTVYIVRCWFSNFIDFSTLYLRSYNKLSTHLLSEQEFN